jgi:hypothetical protein
MRILAPLLVTLLCLASEGLATGCRAQRVAADTTVARQLVEHWQGTPGDTLACLHGRVVLHQGRPVILADRVHFAMACGPQSDTSVIGMLGFTRAGDDQEDDVLAAMQRVLERRPDLLLAGMVHGTEPTPDGAGHWILAPRLWAVWRTSRTWERSPPEPGGS